MNESGGLLISSALASREPVADAAKLKLSPILGLGMVVLLGLLISAAWLVFPYLVKGQNLLSDVGGSVKKERLVTAIGYGRVLTKSTYGPGEAQVDALFATTEYFEATNSARVVSQYRPDKNLVFFVTETTHIEDLPTTLPVAVLTIDGTEYAPIAVEGPLEVYHHRVLTLRFPAISDDGARRFTDDAKQMSLTLVNSWDVGNSPRVFDWKLPIVYPENLANHSAWNPVMILGLSAGLLSFVLTPCLIQLVIVYVMTVTGFSAQQLTGSDRTGNGNYGRVILLSGIAFAVGFTGLFTLTGAVMGHAGKEAQMFFANWSSSISVAAGVLIIAIGLWIGIRSRAPLICRLVPVAFDKPVTGFKSYLGSALTAVGFSLGCITCFGGAIIATLLVYVGISTWYWGLLTLGLYSLGIALPMLAIALGFFKVRLSLTRRLGFNRGLRVASGALLAGIGILILTGQERIVTDVAFGLLGGISRWFA